VRPAPPGVEARLRKWLAGLVAALAQVGAGELVAALLPRGRSPVSGIGQTLIDALPGPSADIVVATAETKDKALLRMALAGSALASGRVAAGLESQGQGRGQALLAGQALVAGAAAASRPENSVASSLLAGLGAGAAGAGALAAATRQPGRVRECALLAAGASGIAAALRLRQRAAADHRREEVIAPVAKQRGPAVARRSEFEIPGITPLFTPNRSFYVTDTVLTAPRVDLDRWRLRVRGLVERELEFSLDELLAMDLVEVDATLVCVHNPVGGDRVGGARWRGVPLAALLAGAGVRSESNQVLTHSVTGFTAGLPLEMIRKGPIPLVALGMNAEPLPVRNGFPARLLTPGIWGADANTKWLATIELTTWDRASDYWDARGWPRVPGIVKPGSRIDVPADRSTLVAGSAVAAGIAWAPARGVSGVEVSIDGGRWRRAELSPEIAPTLWRQWKLFWQARAGTHELRVRTLSGGDIQQEGPAPPYPHGASGYHAIRVTVAEGGALPAAWRARLAGRRADLAARGRLAAMAPPSWRRHGFPGPPTFMEPLPSARRGPRQLLPSRP
jgi:DMSO/TMAO reductase YedYZ molybdopterin-dependent catalytic subunit